MSDVKNPVKTAARRIVILGGGFAGASAAEALETALAGREDVEVTLVSKENAFVFQPLLPEVISGSIGILDPVVPLRRMLARTRIQVREVESVDVSARRVRLRPGLHPHAHELPYDHLVVALGSVTDFRGQPGLPEHALPFKDLADALRLRNRVIQALEEAAIEAHEPALRRELLTFVVAGGGFSGVEVVAELNDFVREVARHYRGIDPSEIRVILLHAQERILPEMAESLALFAQRILSSRQVEIRLGVKLAAATARGAVLASGETIPTRTLVSTVPASPHPVVDALPLGKARNGRIAVDGHLRASGAEGVWALGDTAMIPLPDGSFAPPTAQHATREAQTLARNLIATIDGRPEDLRPFAFKGLGKMGSLGRRNAVAEIFGLRIAGFLAWWLWRTVYLLKVPGWGRRLEIAMSWTLSLFLPPELVEVRLGVTRAVAREHFEAGETVFHEGDLGDRVYVVTAGRAEVVRERQGGAEVVARLGPGECFGEMALLGGDVRSASVRASSALDVISLPERDFALLAGSLPELREAFEGIARRRRAIADLPPQTAGALELTEVVEGSPAGRAA